MNVMQHHVKGDWSPEHRDACMIREINSMTRSQRSAFIKDWTKHHGKKSTDKLKQDCHDAWMNRGKAVVASIDNIRNILADGSGVKAA